MEQESLLLLREALHPSARLRPSGSVGGADAVVELRGGEEIPLCLVPWGQAKRERCTAAQTVWILPHAPDTLRDRLRNEQESYVDPRGAVFLSFPNLLVDRSGLTLPPRPGAVRRAYDPFADRISLVARTLLEEQRDRSWGVRELAEVAGTAPATVTRAVRELERFGVVEVRRLGRDSAIRLVDAHSLFARWTGAYDWTRNRSVTVRAPVGDAFRFLRRLGGALAPHRWALTLHAGASLVAPHAAWDRIHAYVDVPDAEELLDVAEREGWPVGEDGRLVLMKPYHRSSVWHRAREVQGLPVVSDLQLALDLWHYPLRGREQAEHLIGTRAPFG